MAEIGRIGNNTMLYSPLPLISQRLIALSGALAVIVFCLAGCGGKEANKDDSSADQAVGEADSEPAEENPKPKATAKGKKKSGQQGRIGEIPKDVWPEIWLKDPLAVAAESGAADKAPAESTKETTEPVSPTVAEKSDPPAEMPTSAGGKANWSSLITGEILADETKSLKNKLTQQLQDQGRYNAKYKEIRENATLLAVLAAIAPDVPDSPGWKSDAKYVRDLASSISSASKANGDQYYRKAKESYDKLDAVIGGNRPPDVGSAADQVNFSEFADRRNLMLWMERTKNWMKTDVNSEAIFKKEAIRLTQEASALAVVAKVITTPDYSDHDLEDYRNFAETVSQASHGIVAAVKDNDFKAYSELLERYRTACDKCHEVFKNN